MRRIDHAETDLRASDGSPLERGLLEYCDNRARDTGQFIDGACTFNRIGGTCVRGAAFRSSSRHPHHD